MDREKQFFAFLTVISALLIVYLSTLAGAAFGVSLSDDLLLLITGGLLTILRTPDRPNSPTD